LVLGQTDKSGTVWGGEQRADLIVSRLQAMEII
jgi:hypothetical protein